MSVMPDDQEFNAPNLRCPACHGPLHPAKGPVRCNDCGRIWVEKEGIRDFAFPSMDPEKAFPVEAHAEVLAHEEALHYYSWYRASLLEQIILSLFSRRDPLHVLDAGCGTGFIAEWLKKRLPDSRVTLVDAAPQPLQYAKRRNVGPCYLAADENLPFPDEEFDLILSLDVYEHLDRDDAAVKEAYRLLKPGGVHIVFVPGMRVLWNVGDEIQLHRRRYERGHLRRLMEKAGFDVVRVSATLATPLPLALVARIGRQRLLSKKHARDVALLDFRTPPRMLNQCIKWALFPELWVLRHWNLPWGVGLAAIGRKPK